MTFESAGGRRSILPMEGMPIWLATNSPSKDFAKCDNHIPQIYLLCKSRFFVSGDSYPGSSELRLVSVAKCMFPMLLSPNAHCFAASALRLSASSCTV